MPASTPKRRRDASSSDVRRAEQRNHLSAPGARLGSARLLAGDAAHLHLIALHFCISEGLREELSASSSSLFLYVFERS